MQVNVKKLSENAVIPTYAKHGDAGMDLTATSKSYDNDGNVVYGIGLAFEIPHGFVGYVFPRSSNAKKDLVLSNSVGVIDSGYRGEVLFKFKHTKPDYDISEDFEGLDDDKHWRVKVTDASHQVYEVGDRIGQIIIMPIPHIEFNLVDKLSTTDRGVGGFGSTDPITKSIEENLSV